MRKQTIFGDMPLYTIPTNLLKVASFDRYMIEHANDVETRSTYECFNCGELETHGGSPGVCSECGGEFRNRSRQFV
ncbi:MAG: hypothetical protein ACI9YT_001664 [Halobacteriales archaeon]|jgi:hypothetical protein